MDELLIRQAPALRAASAIRTSSPSCVLAASTTGLPRFSLSKMEANSALASLRSAICWSNLMLPVTWMMEERTPTDSNLRTSPLSCTPIASRKEK